MENKISVVINTYNAERHLKEVLESVKDFDEIVVCDMESTDHTLAIAREYGCKIVTFAKKTTTSWSQHGSLPSTRPPIPGCSS